MYNSGILDYYLMWIINVEMYMDKLHFIVNPVAGGTRAIDKFGAVKGMLDDMRFPYTYEFTQCKGHGRELARAAAEHGEKYIIAVGGDGTVNYAVNAMKRKGLDIPVGVIPAGTANDFAGALGMSREPLEAARQIASGSIDRVDAGCVNGLWFVNIFSFGLFTTTSQRTPDARKHKIGKLAYIIEGAKEIRSMHAVPLEIEADDRDGLMLDVATILTSLRLRTSEMSARSVGGGTAIVCLRFGVHNLTELENVRTRLRGISGVHNVERGTE